MPDDERAGYQSRIGELEREVAALKKVVEELLKRQRKEKRQTTPFAREKEKPDKKKAGRPNGHEGDWRQTPDHVDEEVEARLDGCPDCGNEVFDVEELIQFVVDLPEIRAHVLKILTERAWCPCCRRRVRSRHPRQVSKAGGAAAVALGPRAIALATELKHRQGMPYRDIAELFGRYFQLPVSHGALVQTSVRLADKATGDYLSLVTQVQSSPLVATDDTGWRIARRCAWLWVFATDDVTLYVIDYRRSASLVLDVLGEDFDGTVLSDGLPALNALDEKGIDRAQCNGHIIRRCREMALVQTQGAVRFPRDLKQLLQDALELGRVRHSLSAATYDAAVGEVRQALSGLVSQNFTHPDNLRLAKHVFRHQHALLKFLENEAIPPTNNISERELRGAVVARKIGGCHRAEPNAHAHAVLASLAQTAHRRGETLDHHVARWMYGTAGPPN